MAIRTLFFDLDGTLADTEPDILFCLKETFQENKILWDESKIRIGKPLSEMLKIAYPNLTDSDIQKIIVEFRALYNVSSYPETKLYDGMFETLSELRRRSITLFVATNKVMLPTRRLLEKFQIASFFDEVLTPDCFAGETLRKCETMSRTLEKYKLLPEESALIGDHTDDIHAARAAGIRSIAATWGYDAKECLAVARPDVFVQSPKMILHCVGEGNGDE